MTNNVLVLFFGNLHAYSVAFFLHLSIDRLYFSHCSRNSFFVSSNENFIWGKKNILKISIQRLNRGLLTSHYRLGRYVYFGPCFRNQLIDIFVERSCDEGMVHFWNIDPFRSFLGLLIRCDSDFVFSFLDTFFGTCKETKRVSLVWIFYMVNYM